MPSELSNDFPYSFTLQTGMNVAITGEYLQIAKLIKYAKVFIVAAMKNIDKPTMLAHWVLLSCELGMSI